MNSQAFDAFLFYRSYRKYLNGMLQKEQLATLLAIIDYALYGVEPELKGKMPAAIFTVARPIIDVNNAKRKAGKRVDDLIKGPGSNFPGPPHMLDLYLDLSALKKTSFSAPFSPHKPP